MRDYQKGKVYKAEDDALPARYDVYFKSVEAMQAFADKVVASEWWRQRSSVKHVPVTIKRRDAGTSTCYGSRYIRIAAGGHARRIIVLHELAHVITHDGHGPQYCRAFLDLVREFHSQYAHDALLKSMRAHKVNIFDAQHRTMNDLERAGGTVADLGAAMREDTDA